VHVGQIYTVDIELWPTNVVISPGHRIVVEIAAHYTQDCGMLPHNDPHDQSEEKLNGWNQIHFGDGLDNFVTLPIVPKA
jgi:predicted acyl esterase